MKKSSVSMEPTIREKAIQRISKFVKRHRKCYFLGVIAVAAVVVATAVGGLFYNNRKRILSLACILLFFVSSSSFSYPVLPMDVSFVSDRIRIDTIEVDGSGYNTAALSETGGSALSATVSATAAESSEQERADGMISTLNESDISTEDLENMPVDGNGELLGEVRESDQLSLDDIMDADDGTSEYTDEAAAAEDPELAFSADDWKLLLINKQHPIPDGYEFQTAEITRGGKICDARIVDPLKAMFRDAAADGITLVVCSPYRSNNRQEMLFARKVQYYIDKGYDYMESYSLASQAVTIPGSSEHEVGLALDIISDGYCTLDEGFGDTPAGQWLAANSYKYGFIVRYLKGKEEITGIEFEPWHLRYVGPQAAAVMYDEGICLEEFWNEYLY